METLAARIMISHIWRGCSDSKGQISASLDMGSMKNWRATVVQAIKYRFGDKEDRIYSIASIQSEPSFRKATVLRHEERHMKSFHESESFVSIVICVQNHIAPIEQQRPKSHSYHTLFGLHIGRTFLAVIRGEALHVSVDIDMEGSGWLKQRLVERTLEKGTPFLRLGWEWQVSLSEHEVAFLVYSMM